ncbi:MAG: transglutaminase family protein [Burkholderiales bacterium]|nr:transglutaminase family protein [Burkholderiales bacterium]
MVRMEYQVNLQYEAQGQSDFVLNICPARTRSQRVVKETLIVEGATPSYTFTDPTSANRMNRLYTEGGPVSISYKGTVELDQVINDACAIEECEVRSLPSEVIPYIFPSRFCPSDKMRGIAMAIFGNVTPGFARVASICEWVSQHVRFHPGASDATTCAMDTFDSRAGVCRDYSHLMITMCRALNIPARYVTGVDYGADPAFGPTDFHAYVEVFLGKRWYLFDASGMTPVMGLIRIGTGRDAADVAFATLFGNVQCLRPIVGIELVSHDTRLEAAGSMLKAISTAMGSLYFHAAPQATWEAPTISVQPNVWTPIPVPQSFHAPQFA